VAGVSFDISPKDKPEKIKKIVNKAKRVALLVNKFKKDLS